MLPGVICDSLGYVEGGSFAAHIIGAHFAFCDHASDGSFQTFHLDIEVHDLAHLHAIIAALRDAEPVSSVERT